MKKCKREKKKKELSKHDRETEIFEILTFAEGICV